MNPQSRSKILIVEKRPAEASAMGHVFAGLFGDGFDLVRAESLPDAVKRMEEEEFAVVMIDPSLCDPSARDSFLTLRGKASGISVLMVNGLGDQQSENTTVLEGAGDTAVAIQKARLQEGTEKSLQRVRALYEINTAIASTLDVQKILHILLEKLERFVPFVAASTVRLFKPISGALDSLACRGLDREEWLSRQERGPIKGRARQVVDSGAPVVIRNIETSPPGESLGLFHRYGLVSYLGVPLIAHDEIVGVLGLYTRREYEFSENEIEFVNTLAGQAAVAIYNGQLFEDIKRANEEARALREINLAIASTLDLRSQISMLFDKMLQRFAGCVLTLRLLNKETGVFEAMACRNIDESEWKNTMPKLGMGGPHQVVLLRRPVVIADVQRDPRVAYPDFFRRCGLVSYLGVPLTFQADVLGVLGVFAREAHEFTDTEIDFVSSLAEQAAIAIHNAQLYERTRLQARDLEVANKVKDDFLSVVSHELRTPLNITIGYLGLMKEGLLGELTEEQKSALQKIMNHSADQLAMVDEILATTTLESRTVYLDRQRIDVTDILKELQADFEMLRQENQPALVWRYPQEPLSIVTDRRKLRQVMQNLIGNALKFTESGAITVSVKAVSRLPEQLAFQHKEFAQDGEWLEVTVSDTGRGIPLEKLNLIFDKFYQLDSSMTRPYSGLGLGLYIAQQYAQLLGGTIQVESELGRGSTFTVTLPVSP
jgi:signal transduction histidine kinase